MDHFDVDIDVLVFRCGSSLDRDSDPQFEKDRLSRRRHQGASKRFWKIHLSHIRAQVSNSRELRKLYSQHRRPPLQSCATTTAPRSTGPWASGRRCSFHGRVKIVCNLSTYVKIVCNRQFSRCTRSSQPVGTCQSTTRCYFHFTNCFYFEIVLLVNFWNNSFTIDEKENFLRSYKIFKN